MPTVSSASSGTGPQADVAVPKAKDSAIRESVFRVTVNFVGNDELDFFMSVVSIVLQLPAPRDGHRHTSGRATCFVALKKHHHS